MGNFSALEHLIQIYFGQDSYEITGATTLAGVMGFYLRDNPPTQIKTLIADVAEFEAAYPDTLDDEFMSRWGNDVAPELWGETTVGFLNKIKFLAENAQSKN
ncbi:contact-dependent growth inhibition system immunity protein [Serratia sp. CC22-02]|uniref:contact-dependent growth inhibition system immunity protein n=1 Tax=Serratia sp. CC22-02 TaxID=1378076 RepID=UPI0032D8B871